VAEWVAEWVVEWVVVVGLVEVAVESSKQKRLALATIWLIGLAGCSSLSSVTHFPRVPRPVASSKPSALARLEDPKGKQLAISWETAKLAEQRGMDSEAIAAYLEVRKINPSAVGVSHGLAVLYDRSGMTDAASREYRAALLERPQDPDVHCDYGYFLYSNGHSAEAEVALKQSLQFAPEHHQATINLALVVGNQRRYDESLQLFTRAIGPAAALHNVGMLKLRAGETASARQMLAEASRRDPSISEEPRVLETLNAQDQANARTATSHADATARNDGTTARVNHTVREDDASGVVFLAE